MASLGANRRNRRMISSARRAAPRGEPPPLRRAAAALRDPSGLFPHATAPRHHVAWERLPRFASGVMVAVHVLRLAPVGVNRRNRRMISSGRSTTPRGEPPPLPSRPLRRCVILPIPFLTPRRHDATLFQKPPVCTRPPGSRARAEARPPRRESADESFPRARQREDTQTSPRAVAALRDPYALEAGGGSPGACPRERRATR